MTVKIPTYDVLLSDPTEDDPEATVEHRVRILNGDQLRAELEAPRHGLNDMEAVPMHFQTLWIWAALTRTHAIDDPFPALKQRLLAYSEVKDDPDPEASADPTQPGAATD